MDFNNNKYFNNKENKYKSCLLYFIFNIFVLLNLANCSNNTNEDNKEEFKIGQKVDSLSSMSNQNGSDRKILALFDKTIRKIQVFDIDQMLHLKKIAVENSDEKHFVYVPDSAEYIIDMSSKRLTIYNIKLNIITYSQESNGLPRSLAVNDSLGFIVTQDQNRTVSVLKVTPNGYIISPWKAGSQITPDKTFTSGDILNDGTLALGLSDNSLVFIDLENSLLNRQWTLKQDELPIENISTSEIVWVGPSQKDPDKILLRAKEELLLWSRSQRLTLERFDTTNWYTEKYSKSIEPHIVFRNKKSSLNDKLMLTFCQNSKLSSFTIYDHPETIVNSKLDLYENQWSFTDVLLKTPDVFARNEDFDLNDIDQGRRYRRYRTTSDFLLEENMKIPDTPQVLLGLRSLFTLYPSELGYAVKYSFDGTPNRELKFFNLKDLGK